MTRKPILTAAAIALLSLAGTAGTAGTAAAGQSAQNRSSSDAQGAMQQNQAGGAWNAVDMRGMLGRQVVGTDGKPIGHLSDIMLDPGTNHPNVAVIETGGKEIVIDYTLLQNQGDHLLARQLTQQEASEMNAYDQAGNFVSLSKQGTGENRDSMGTSGSGQSGND